MHCDPNWPCSISIWYSEKLVVWIEADHGGAVKVYRPTSSSEKSGIWEELVNRLRWFGHVVHMMNDWLPKTALHAMTTGQRSRVRQKKTLVMKTKTWIRKTVISIYRNNGHETDSVIIRAQLRSIQHHRQKPYKLNWSLTETRKEEKRQTKIQKGHSISIWLRLYIFKNQGFRTS